MYSKDEKFTKLGSTFTAGEYIRTLTMLTSNKKNMKEKRMKRGRGIGEEQQGWQEKVEGANERLVFSEVNRWRKDGLVQKRESSILFLFITKCAIYQKTSSVLRSPPVHLTLLIVFGVLIVGVEGKEPSLPRAVYVSIIIGV